MRALFLGLLIALLGYGALVFLQWKMGLGDFAKGPEELTLLRYDRKMVGGGRAGVEYLGLEGTQLSFLLHCREDGDTVSRPVRLVGNDRSAKACGVYLRLLEKKGGDAFAVRIEVSWDPR